MAISIFPVLSKNQKLIKISRRPVDHIPSAPRANPTQPRTTLHPRPPCVRVSSLPLTCRPTHCSSSLTQTQVQTAPPLSPFREPHVSNYLKPRRLRRNPSRTPCHLFLKTKSSKPPPFRRIWSSKIFWLGRLGSSLWIGELCEGVVWIFVN